jgi:hypothetical protein
MAYIIAIPSFYQTKFYPFTPSSDHPTTTARYIALLPTCSPIQQDRDYAIAKDAVAWGWHVYDTDPALPAMKSWWKTYEDTVQKKSCTWDDDLWRIWQREHGVRILQKDLQVKAGKGEGEGLMLGGLKKAGRRIKRGMVGREAVEFDLRQLEDKKREVRGREKRREKKKKEEASIKREAEESTVSLPRSFMERLGRFEMKKGSDDGKTETVGEGKGTEGVGLSRHSW